MVYVCLSAPKDTSLTKRSVLSAILPAKVVRVTQITARHVNLIYCLRRSLASVLHSARLGLSENIALIRARLVTKVVIPA